MVVPFDRRLVLAVLLVVLLVSAGCARMVNPSYSTHEGTWSPSPPPDTPEPFDAFEQTNVVTPNASDLPSSKSQVDDIDVDAVERTMIERINELRSNRSLRTVREDPRLSKLALQKSYDMGINDYFLHGRPGEPEKNSDWRFSVKYRYRCADHTRGGENLARAHWNVEYRSDWLDEEDGFTDTEYELGMRLVEIWWNSRSHRELLLRENMSTVGVGVFVVDREMELPEAYATLYLCP